MRKWLASLTPSVFGTAVKVCGLMLVLVATAGTARASLAPEVDPGSMVSALTLLSGGLLIFGDRLRRK
jgi:hypothetical protein